jgi:hypothetical protein
MQLDRLCLNFGAPIIDKSVRAGGLSARVSGQPKVHFGELGWPVLNMRVSCFKPVYKGVKVKEGTVF